MSVLTDTEINEILSLQKTYADSGLGTFLQRVIDQDTFQSFDEASTLIEGLSLSQILSSGSTSSAIGSIKFDFTNGTITIGDTILWGYQKDGF